MISQPSAGDHKAKATATLLDIRRAIDLKCAHVHTHTRQVSRLTAEPNAGLFCAHAAIREQTARLLGAYAAWMSVNGNVNVPAVLSVLLHGLQVLWMDCPSLAVLFGVRFECVQAGEWL